jgi:hypothetical protein
MHLWIYVTLTCVSQGLPVYRTLCKHAEYLYSILTLRIIKVRREVVDRV